MNNILIEKYANLIVNVGANVQKDQIVDISSSLENAWLAEIIMEKCYQAGAKFVSIQWVNDKTSVIAYKYASLDVLKEIKPYTRARLEWLTDNKVVRIHIDDDDPNAFKDVDSEKMAESSKDISKLAKDLFDKIEGEYQWCIAAAPSKKWAKQVFPNDTEEEAVQKLWNLIFKMCRIDESTDELALWKEHNDKLVNRCKFLNDLDLEYVQYKNSLGTNLKVYLADGHIWQGGKNITKQGIDYLPNIPTEEVFSTPHAYKVDGTLVSTFPLNYNGVLIKDMRFTFKDGKVIDFSASEGQDTLKHMLNMDENSNRLGEIALVPYNNPINNSKTLFYSTLFDENASCHFAFGECYNDTIKNYEKYSEEELNKKGCNNSIIHVDFMVGSSDLSIIGHTKKGEDVVIFENGNFAFEK